MQRQQQPQRRAEVRGISCSLADDTTLLSHIRFTIYLAVITMLSISGKVHFESTFIVSHEVRLVLLYNGEMIGV